MKKGIKMFTMATMICGALFLGGCGSIDNNKDASSNKAVANTEDNSNKKNLTPNELGNNLKIENITCCEVTVNQNLKKVENQEDIEKLYQILSTVTEEKKFESTDSFDLIKSHDSCGTHGSYGAAVHFDTDTEQPGIAKSDDRLSYLNTVLIDFKNGKMEYMKRKDGGAYESFYYYLSEDDLARVYAILDSVIDIANSPMPEL